MSPPSNILLSIIGVLLLPSISIICTAYPEQGKWDFNIENAHAPNMTSVMVPKSLLAGSKLILQITCDSINSPTTMVKIQWDMRPLLCVDDDTVARTAEALHEIEEPIGSYGPVPFYRECAHGGHILLDEFRHPSTKNNLNEPAVAGAKVESAVDIQSNREKPIYVTTVDSMYYFHLSITSDQGIFNATVHVEMKAPYGYLSGTDYPLLLFYGTMCLVYLAFGIIWLIVSFMQWRDLLRIQFWIGGVILLGMLEKAVFYAEYQTINSVGVSVHGAVLLAEWVSCAKRTLARMLVIIVSLGFGIVKPRLGPMLHRVVGTGALYFVLAAVESYLRVMQNKNDRTNQVLVATIPLAVLDSAICWWIFTSLVQTTRTLRLRRNSVKLTLYRHFTNTLIFSVIASVIFMLFSIKHHGLSNNCLQEWKELWQDEAFWHVQFSLLLLVIMILWRPTNNNQRYAFTPLLDNPEDEDDDDEEEHFVSDAYGVKMRSGRSASPKLNAASKAATTNEEDDLRWVEENIPQAMADAALPVLDSDEEILNTKFEVSKMQ